MSIENLKKVLLEKPGYLKKGSQYLSDKFEVKLEEAIQALREAREALKDNVVEEVKDESEKTYEIQVPQVKEVSIEGRSAYKLLVLSDIHGIFVDTKAWEAVLSVINNNHFDEIVLNGDIMDFPLISKYDAKLFSIPLMKNYSEILEVEFTKQYILLPLRTLAPNSKIVYRLGNHEERLTEGKYSGSADRIAKLFKHYNTSELNQMLELDKLDIEYDPTNSRNYFNVFDVVHGLSLSKNAPEKNIYEYMGSGTSGHSHRLNSTYIKNKSSNYVWVESGCLRTIEDVEYIPTGKTVDWMQGFVTVDFDVDNGYFYSKTHPIVNGTCEYNGVIYK